MRFLADESCDFAVVRALRAEGHDVAAVVETARGARDVEVIRRAQEEERVLLTEDNEPLYPASRSVPRTCSTS